MPHQGQQDPRTRVVSRIFGGRRGPVTRLGFLAVYKKIPIIPLAVIASIVEYWLKPMLVGRRGEMHTLLVFLALIGGLTTYGAVGILIGPLMMTAFLTLVSIYHERYRPWLDTPAPEPGPTTEPESDS